jgi:hypothetical protein
MLRQSLRVLKQKKQFQTIPLEIKRNFWNFEFSEKDEKKFQKIYQKSLEDPEEFWNKASEDITWIKTPTKTLDDSNVPFYKWFKGGLLNSCYNALDVRRSVKIIFFRDMLKKVMEINMPLFMTVQ